LKSEYNFNPKIPTCYQLEADEEKVSDIEKKNKQLSVKQTNDTRLVTKVDIK
jgi:hypothetical protein